MASTNPKLERGITVVTQSNLPSSPQAMQILERLGRSGLLACPPVALPDLHLKPRLETPSSTATATRDTLVLGLTSPSPNCGMALAATPLGADDLDAERLDDLFKRLASALDPDNRPPAIDDAALDAILLHGAAANTPSPSSGHSDGRQHASRFTLTAIAGSGQAFSPDEASADHAAILSSVPKGFRPVARQKFGLVGRGNHFLEVQVVDQVLDEPTATAWGLSAGQVLVMSHVDSGYLGAIAGRLFAHRRKNSLRGRLIEWRIKLPYHLRGKETARRLRRLRYFLPRRWLSIQADSHEGRRCRWALGAATNYAFAGRLAVLNTLAQTLSEVWGAAAGQTQLLYDAPHNGVWREQIGERVLWVHRHNAARVVPPSRLPAGSVYEGTGHPVLLPGTERTSSYLCASGEGAAHTLHSAGHGAGHTVQALSRPLDEPARFTRVYGYDDAPVERRPHWSDDGVDAVLGALAAHDIVRPVIRLRPVAVLKG
ncbi:MAG: RtcB family protein [Chloroflexi bacterium]|nr:RtcB family protein [Chloroflexota bacterium]